MAYGEKIAREKDIYGAPTAFTHNSLAQSDTEGAKPTKDFPIEDKERMAKVQESCVWVLRGKAFAAIGSAFLAEISFREAKCLNDSYPGLDAGLKLVEEVSIYVTLTHF